MQECLKTPKVDFDKYWGEYARSTDNDVALIDRMGRDACQDHLEYRLFIEGIDRLIIQVMNAKPVHSMYMSPVARSRRDESNSGFQLSCSFPTSVESLDSILSQ